MSMDLADCPFRSYGKMSEDTTHWNLKGRHRWVVTEKIHGANFSLHTRGERVWCGKRREVLEESEHSTFFHFMNVKNELEQRVLALHGLVQEHVQGHDVVTSVYGELFGGVYRHPEVQPDPSVQPVQEGVQYHPSIKFCAFDVAWMKQGADGELEQSYADFAQMQQWCRQCDIFCVAALYTGSLEKALAYPLPFNSTIPGRLGLPPLASNSAEGVVIRSADEFMVETNKGLRRALVKKKIEEFAEAKYSAAKKWSQERRGENSGDGQVQIVMLEMEAMVTRNRLDNAISKTGPVSAHERERVRELLEMYAEDVRETLLDQCGAEWEQLRADQRQMVEDRLEVCCKEVILEYLKERRRAERSESASSTVGGAV